MYSSAGTPTSEFGESAILFMLQHLPFWAGAKPLLVRHPSGVGGKPLRGNTPPGNTLWGEHPSERNTHWGEHTSGHKPLPVGPLWGKTSPSGTPLGNSLMHP